MNDIMNPFTNSQALKKPRTQQVMFEMKHGVRSQYVIGQKYVDEFRKVNSDSIENETALSKEDFSLFKKHSVTSETNEPPTKRLRFTSTNRLNGFYMLSRTGRSAVLIIEFTSRFGGDAWYFQAEHIARALWMYNKVGPLTDDFLFEALSNIRSGLVSGDVLPFHPRVAIRDRVGPDQLLHQ